MGMQNFRIRNADAECGMVGSKPDAQGACGGCVRPKRPRSRQEPPSAFAKRPFPLSARHTFLAAARGADPRWSAANFDKPLFFSWNRNEPGNWRSFDFANHVSNARVRLPRSAGQHKPGCQMMPSKASDNNDAVDVNEVFVTGLKKNKPRKFGFS